MYISWSSYLVPLIVPFIFYKKDLCKALSELCLTAYVFEPHQMFVYPDLHICFSNLLFMSKRAICGCLPMGTCISPHIGMEPHVRKGVKEHDVNQILEV